jgi:uncharacterized protein involved in response to NO
MNDMQQHDVCFCMHSMLLLVVVVGARSLLCFTERQLAKKADDRRPKTAQNKIKLTDR